jgi:uncharacterized protein YdhG (YjbR/CyaY superfamily)
MNTLNEIDKYIAGFPEETQKIMQHLRTIIRNAAPEAKEVISYAMPAYRQNSILVYFAGYKHHIGFYPTPNAIKAFKNELADYKWSKGAVQFPLSKPLPVELIERMVRFRLEEDTGKPSKR